MNQEPLLVKDVGEQGLLQRLQRFCLQGVVGDDAAVLEFEPDKSLVVTTDVLVDKVHFSDRTTEAFDVGWRAAAANLSDLAAMGAEPIGITVGLSLPGAISVDWVEELYRGLSACLTPYQTPIIGGDLCRSEVVTIAITALGKVVPEKAIRRSQARVGDAIAITGYHGLSRAGLELLLDRTFGTNLSSSERAELMRAHQQPQPRLDVINLLRTLAPVTRIAGMDSSDGLADAVWQICRASSVGATIDSAHLPISPLLQKLVPRDLALQWILYGGEDFELVLCLPQEIAVTLTERLGRGAAIIGSISFDPKCQLIDRHSGNLSKILNLPEGFQHF
jgi:thiamine-monophosphate kinase